MSHAPEFVKLVDDAKSRIREMTPEEVREKQIKNAGFFLVDTREDNEWDRGHIPGAIHLGRGIIERDIGEMIPDKESAVVLYCGGGYRSALAADNLQKMGYSNIVSMSGGWRKWKELGYPVE